MRSGSSRTPFHRINHILLQVEKIGFKMLKIRDEVTSGNSQKKISVMGIPPSSQVEKCQPGERGCCGQESGDSRRGQSRSLEAPQPTRRAMN